MITIGGMAILVDSNKKALAVYSNLTTQQKPSAPIENLLPTTRVKLLINRAVQVTETPQNKVRSMMRS